MSRLWTEARAFQSKKPESFITETCKLNWLQTFSIKPSKVWRKPDHEKEGPTWDEPPKIKAGCHKMHGPAVFLGEDQLRQDLPGTNFASMLKTGSKTSLNIHPQ